MQRRTICLAALTTGIAATSRAQEMEVVFATGEYPPFTSQGLPEQGATTALVTAICQAAGLRPVYRFYPWRRAESMVETGEAFAAFPYGINKERKERFDFSDVLYMVRNAVVYHAKDNDKNLPPRFEKLQDLRAYRVGVIQGSFAEGPLRESGVRYETASTVEQSIKKLQAGRIDLYIDDQAVIFDAVSRLYPDQVDRFRALPKAFNEQAANHLMVSRSYPNAATLLLKFNAGLAAIKASGEYQRIVRKYRLSPAN
ncbi:transporter substrate-binding domain-containing protein [Curvibacter sp. APW13]|uniref:substrate-binding periplasmic protein n=1 Tax=Curvibacter sp. APW13 TaxID=3077236 RepID=UPI0028DF8444|nr:transporter substrate-binding domain-containing protein [Curvibacter sp. APW13]MDT8991375.1 transporter substrate-binding domain-containing protein [Curvibacter sp. APW13]